MTPELGCYPLGMMSETNGDRIPSEPPPPSEIEVLQHGVAECLFNVHKVEQRIQVLDTIARDCADNTFRLLQRSDPLTWTKRAWILGLSSAFGSAFGAACVHTIYLAFFRR